jgi:hypothetical protein
MAMLPVKQKIRGYDQPVLGKIDCRKRLEDGNKNDEVPDNSPMDCSVFVSSFGKLSRG